MTWLSNIGATAGSMSCATRRKLRLVVHSKGAKAAQAGETGGLYSEQMGLGL
jgi:hypothetical protein